MSKKERRQIAAFGFAIVLTLGVLYYFYGKMLIDALMCLIGVVIYWVFGATIALGLVVLIVMFFLSDKQIEWLCDDSKRTERERLEAEAIEAYFNKRRAQNDNESENNESNDEIDE